MKFPASIIFSSSLENLGWLQDVVDYVSAYCTDSALWPLIKNISQEEKARRQNQSQATGMISMPFAYPEAGYVSNLFFISLTFKRGKGKGEDGGIPNAIVDRAFALLADKGMLFEQHTENQNPFSIKEYTVNSKLVKYLVENDLVYNHLFGFEYII